MNNKQYNNKAEQYKYLGSLKLAFLGDSIYEFMVKKRLFEDNPNLSIYKLHRLATYKIQATSQAKAYDYIKYKLTETEYLIMKRGQNSAVHRYPKNVDPKDYHKSTGLETLFGYLVISNNDQKLKIYFNDIYNFLDNLYYNNKK